MKENEIFENHTLAKGITAPKVSIIVPTRLSTKPARVLEKNISAVTFYHETC